MTQTERLKQYLKKHRWIEPFTAWKELGIYRLGARIYDLKKQGLPIRRGNMGVLNRFGEKCYVAKYILEE